MGWFAVFRSRRMATVFLLGFSSGLPRMLTGQTLQAWLTAEQLSLDDIAAVSGVRTGRSVFSRIPLRRVARSCSDYAVIAFASLAGELSGGSAGWHGYMIRPISRYSWRAASTRSAVVIGRRDSAAIRAARSAAFLM
jgi:hypothetical protein